MVILVTVHGRLEEVVKLHGVIADTSTTGAFREEAKTQKTAADEWRVVAVWFGILAAVLAVGAIVLAALEPDAASSAGAVLRAGHFYARRTASDSPCPSWSLS